MTVKSRDLGSDLGGGERSPGVGCAKLRRSAPRSSSQATELTRVLADDMPGNRYVDVGPLEKCSPRKLDLLNARSAERKGDEASAQLDRSQRPDGKRTFSTQP